MPVKTHIKGVVIAQPCHENWDAMDEVEKGRYCQSCSKIVYDFTDEDPTEFFRLYRESKGQMCGNFYKAQPVWLEYSKNALVSLVKQSKVAMLAISIGLASLKSASAQQKTDAAVVTTAMPDTGFITLSFKIKNRTTEELVKESFKVTAKLKDYELTINSVSDGIATFTIPASLVDTKVVIELENEKYGEINLTYVASPEMRDVYVLDKKAQEKAYRKMMRKYKKHWWQFWKRRRHVRGKIAF